METIVLSMCGFWFWLTRRYRVCAYSQAAGSLYSAHAYLVADFLRRASTRDRGALVPHQLEALDILQQHGTETYVSATRLASLRECCRLFREHMTEQYAPAPEPVIQPRRSPARLRPVRVRLNFSPLVRFWSGLATYRNPIASFASFWNSELSGFMWRHASLRMWRFQHVIAQNEPARKA
jgi:hypothetical protein